MRRSKMLKSLFEYCTMVVVILFYIWLGIKVGEYYYDANGPTLRNVVDTYGLLPTMVLYGCSISIYLGMPVAILNTCGLLLYNPFNRKCRLTNSSKESAFICFRVVTRGLYPRLVHQVTERNIATVLQFGITNFKFEVVTDNEINLPKSHYIREIVIPQSYTTQNGALFKSRALHHCLEPDINILSGEDWIVHLDEETTLTQSALRGISNFISAPHACIGQGVITYGGLEIENWFTTLLDGARTTIDYGLFRLGLQLFHRPVFGFKGSFIVIKMSIEADIGFDFGPRESIAEDLRFALTAWTKRYRFDFVEGVMMEKSTFSVADFIKQRKRWLIGHFHIVWTHSLPLYTKIAILPMHVSNLLLWTNILYTFLPLVIHLPMTKLQLLSFFCLSTNFHFTIMFGNFMSLRFRRQQIVFKCVICFLSQFLVICLGFIEAFASLKGVLHRNKLAFDIVEKDSKSCKKVINVV